MTFATIVFCWSLKWEVCRFLKDSCGILCLLIILTGTETTLNHSSVFPEFTAKWYFGSQLSPTQEKKNIKNLCINNYTVKKTNFSPIILKTTGNVAHLSTGDHYNYKLRAGRDLGMFMDAVQEGLQLSHPGRGTFTLILKAIGIELLGLLPVNREKNLSHILIISPMKDQIHSSLPGWDGGKLLFCRHMHFPRRPK